MAKAEGFPDGNNGYMSMTNVTLQLWSNMGTNALVQIYFAHDMLCKNEHLVKGQMMMTRCLETVNFNNSSSDILKCHCEAMARQDDDAYLAVQHVRDQLLPPAHR